MKYVVILIDGIADYPIDELGKKTPLESAITPTLDMMAASGGMGMVKTIPEGMPPGSDVANLSILGYDPAKYHSGRSPFEAISLGIDFLETDIVFRCNLVTLSGEEDYRDRIMIDHSAGEIPTHLSKRLIEDIAGKIQTERIRFYPGVSYRNIMVWTAGPGDLKLTPPHDIIDKKIAPYLPLGKEKDLLIDMMIKAGRLLSRHEINKELIKKGQRPANSIWLWGKGRKPGLDSFYGKFGLKGSVIAAVDLIKGIGICGGLEAIKVDGATGTINTNFKGKADAAIKELRVGKDFVYVHLEAPDECGHQGDAAGKVKALELIDEKIVSRIKKALEESDLDFKIMVLPDHPTPVSLRTHTSEPVPFLIYKDSKASGIKKGEDLKNRKNDIRGAARFSESRARKTGLYFKEGFKLLDYFLDQASDK